MLKGEATVTMTTWRKEIQRALNFDGKDFADVKMMPLTDEALDREFDIKNCDLSICEHFVMWTNDYVYFSTYCDGHVGIESVPQHPEGISRWL